MNLRLFNKIGEFRKWIRSQRSETMGEMWDRVHEVKRERKLAMMSESKLNAANKLMMFIREAEAAQEKERKTMEEERCKRECKNYAPHIGGVYGGTHAARTATSARMSANDAMLAHEKALRDIGAPPWAAPALEAAIVELKSVIKVKSTEVVRLNQKIENMQGMCRYKTSQQDNAISCLQANLKESRGISSRLSKDAELLRDQCKSLRSALAESKQRKYGSEYVRCLEKQAVDQLGIINRFKERVNDFKKSEDYLILSRDKMFDELKIAKEKIAGLEVCNTSQAGFLGNHSRTIEALRNSLLAEARRLDEGEARELKLSRALDSATLRAERAIKHDDHNRTVAANLDRKLLETQQKIAILAAEEYKCGMKKSEYLDLMEKCLTFLNLNCIGYMSADLKDRLSKVLATG